ncbi:hypothetical protein MNBD_NITROSPIRAE03-307 [hydrothermal vent metagenome]|uniref:Helix-turn-helix type 11 domain-containing protein n=1 Tax=hydrothermal vent metagenome TaxID=652676 RepID=A0A3B1DQQ5_9ZZZZ
MKKEQKNIKIGLSTEEQVNKEFIEAWHRAEKDEIKVPEERLYFLDPVTFFKVLSKRRIALLQVLHSHGSTSIRHLSKVLKRDYKNVYQDVQLLKHVGLICQDETKKIYVPWDKINAEIPLAA